MILPHAFKMLHLLGTWGVGDGAGVRGVITQLIAPDHRLGPGNKL